MIMWVMGDEGLFYVDDYDSLFVFCLLEMEYCYFLEN